MAPTWTAKPGKEVRANAVTPKRFRSKPKRHLVDNPTPEFGLQKLKSSLRSTKRLLAKDDLAADVRVEAERRLIALDGDLARRQIAEKERSLAIRYHKIKFFERQKVLRKIRQASKSLPSSSTTTELGNALFEARVDLNYILHYPKTKKYISLFPPQVRHGTSSSSQFNSGVSNTDRERQEIRDWVRQQMNDGKLPMEPELLVDLTEKKAGDKNGGDTTKLRQRVSSRRDVAVKTKSLPVKPARVVESDDFFEESNDNSESNENDDGESDSDSTTSTDSKDQSLS